MRAPGFRMEVLAAELVYVFGLLLPRGSYRLIPSAIVPSVVDLEIQLAAQTSLVGSLVAETGAGMTPQERAKVLDARVCVPASANNSILVELTIAGVTIQETEATATGLEAGSSEGIAT